MLFKHQLNIDRYILKMYEGLRSIRSVDRRKERFLNCHLWVKKKILHKYWEQFLPKVKQTTILLKGYLENIA